MFSVSATKLTLYRECRKRYYHKYVLEETEPETTALIFGKAVHAAVEKYYTERCDPVGVFQHVFEEDINANPNAIVYEQPDTLRGLGELLLESFPWFLYEPSHVEYAFSVPLVDDIQLDGRFDLLTTDDYIVDIKTGKRIGNLEQNIQFSLYVHAFQCLFQKEPKGVIWHHFRTHQQYVISTQTLNAYLPTVIALAKKLREDTFDDVAVCASCLPYCQFNPRNSQRRARLIKEVQHDISY